MCFPSECGRLHHVACKISQFCCASVARSGCATALLGLSHCAAALGATAQQLRLGSLHCAAALGATAQQLRLGSLHCAAALRATAQRCCRYPRGCAFGGSWCIRIILSMDTNTVPAERTIEILTRDWANSPIPIALGLLLE